MEEAFPISPGLLHQKTEGVADTTVRSSRSSPGWRYHVREEMPVHPRRFSPNQRLSRGGRPLPNPVSSTSGRLPCSSSSRSDRCLQE